MKRYKKVMISYESEDCKNYLLLLKHSKNFEELKHYLDMVMKTRKVYNYHIHSIEDVSEGEAILLKQLEEDNKK